MYFSHFGAQEPLYYIAAENSDLGTTFATFTNIVFQPQGLPFTKRVLCKKDLSTFSSFANKYTADNPLKQIPETKVRSEKL